MTAMTGNIFWMAPEVVNPRERGYNAKIDIWSLGCTFIEMLTGKRPWYDAEAIAVVVKLYSDAQAPPIPEDCMLSEAAEDFRRACFAVYVFSWLVFSNWTVLT